jgi:hypothetical protein
MGGHFAAFSRGCPKGVTRKGNNEHFGDKRVFRPHRIAATAPGGLQVIGNPGFCGQHMALEEPTKPTADHGRIASVLPDTDYLTILERLPQPAIFADRNGTIVAMNREGLGLLEADSAAQVVGRTIVSFLASEAQSETAANYGQTVKGAGALRYYDLVTLKGKRRTIESCVSTFCSLSGG